MGSPALLQYPVYMPGMYLVSKYMAPPRGMDTAKENTVGFVDRRRDAGLPDLLLVAVRPYLPCMWGCPQYSLPRSASYFIFCLQRVRWGFC